MTNTDHGKLDEFLQELRQYQERAKNPPRGRGLTIGSGPTAVTIGSREAEDWDAHIESLRSKLVRDKGWAKSLVAKLTGKSPIAVAFGLEFDAWDRALEKSPDAPLKDWALDSVADAVSEAVGLLEVEAGSTPLKLNSPLLLPKAFIAHCGTTKALDRLCEFLRALGVEPIVVEQRPSEGISADRQVQKHVEDADCGIIFATKGGIRDTRSGREHPRLNAIDELARLRGRFPNRVILLLETGVDLPSNLSEVLYERFTRNNLEKAFMKVAKELRAFGIIRAARPRP